MDAWIDCMTSLHDPAAGMSGIVVGEGEILTMVVDGAKQLRDNCPDQYAGLIECASFVNWRRIESGDKPILALAMHV